MLRIEVIVASTRPGRAGLPIGKWFMEFAKSFVEEKREVLGEIELCWSDLAEINLPFLDEPNHPRFKKYEHEHTKAWSERVEKADAFVVVTPEYNYMLPAPLLNAFDYLYSEWKYKPLSFVSYGGVSAGTRSVQSAKQVVTALGMMPIQEAVNIPFFAKYITDGVFTPPEETIKAAGNMLTELVKWATALKAVRSK